MQAIHNGLDNALPMQSTSRPPGHWFDGRSLARLTDPITWQRGMALYVSQHVLGLDIVPSGAGWILLGEVLGSKRDTYEVSIELALSTQGQVAQWDSLCECPVGVQCKHGVALMLKAAQQGLRLLQILPEAPVPVPARSAEQLEAERQAVLALEQEAARLVAENHLPNWLRELDRVSPSTSGAARRDVHTPKDGPTADRADCFLFLLSIAQGTGSKPQLLLEAALCKRKANGDWAKPRLVRYAPPRVNRCATTPLPQTAR